MCISQSFSHILHCHFSRNILNKRKRKRSFPILSVCETNNNSQTPLFCEKQIIRAPLKGFSLYACNFVFIFRYRQNLLVGRVHYSVKYYIYFRTYPDYICIQQSFRSTRTFVRVAHSR